MPAVREGFGKMRDNQHWLATFAFIAVCLVATWILAEPQGVPTLAPPKVSLLKYQPAMCPPVGICLPVNYVRCRDADTPVVSFPGSDREWAVRLLECWVDDTPGDRSTKAVVYADSVCRQSKGLRLFVPFEQAGKPIKHPTDLFTFDRILGYLYVSDGRTLNELVVESGFATTVKPSKHDGSR